LSIRRLFGDNLYLHNQVAFVDYMFDIIQNRSIIVWVCILGSYIDQRNQYLEYALIKEDGKTSIMTMS
jgi:hypothetical protein